MAATMRGVRVQAKAAAAGRKKKMPAPKRSAAPKGGSAGGLLDNLLQKNDLASLEAGVQSGSTAKGAGRYVGYKVRPHQSTRAARARPAAGFRRARDGRAGGSGADHRHPSQLPTTERRPEGQRPERGRLGPRLQVRRDGLPVRLEIRRECG